MNALIELLEALGYEVEARDRYVVGHRQEGGTRLVVYLSPEGEVRLEKRRVTAEAVVEKRIADVPGQYVRREEVFEVFFAREVENPARLIMAWEQLDP